MRVVIARTIADFSMDIYATGIINGLRTVRPTWEIIDLRPKPIDRSSKSVLIRAQKAYERFWHFPRTIRQQQADIYHIIEAAEAHAVYGIKRSQKKSHKSSPKKVVVTCHDLINFYHQDNLKGSVQLPFVSRSLWLRAIRGMKQADHVVAVSAATAQETSKILDISPDRITVTPNGVDPAFQPLSSEQVAAVRQQHKLASDTLCLLNVGSNHPRKNVLTLLRVVEKLKQQGLPVCFWKVSADFTDEQKAFIHTHGLASCVSYLGQPTQDELVRIYGAADILIAPSLQEGFGLTILEAMAAGTPVITSNVSAMPEVAGDAAILVEPTDVEAIAAAIQTIHQNAHVKNELIQKGLKRAQQFTWQASAEKVAQVYEALIRP
jgi:glycosyltransferase involved in cell wall biosynthesis